MDVPEGVKRQIVTTKLTQFYRTYCPQKLYIVAEAYQQFSNDLNTLFDELLRKYPRAPQNYFDDISELLVNGGNAADVSDDSYEEPRAIPLHQVVAALSDGEALLESSPARMTDAERHRLTGGDPTGEEALDEELATLHKLQEENRSLAKEVAVAEVQVLAKRFQILLKRCLREAEREEPCPSSMDSTNATCVLHIFDEGRSLEVPMNHHLWRFMLEGPLNAPLPPAHEREASTCVVQPSHEAWSTSVSKNILALALRQWSKIVPHTVTEIVNGVPTFHSSSVLWWQWPSSVKVVRGVTAESMFEGNLQLSALDMVMQLRAGERDGLDDEILALFEDRADLNRGPDSDYWVHFLDHWDTLGQQVDRRYKGAL